MTTRPLRRDLGTALSAVVLGLLAACTSSPAPDTSGSSADQSGSSTAPTSVTPAPTASTPTDTPTSPEPTGLPQAAVWPDAATVLATPEDAAASFVESALGVPARLGEYRAGDARSGEIELLFSGNPNATPVVRSLILVRRLGAGDGWFVLAATNDAQQITAPGPGATVPAGPLSVTGVGRGFEGLVVVDAVRPGSGERLARATAQGGSLEQAEPYTVTLDLSAARPGETIALVAHGGVGHEDDPGDLAAIPVVIDG